MSTTEENITELENWFKDCGPGALRPKFLSKLALIELCGWLEGWMDSAIREIDAATTKDKNWVDEVILSTHGFDYSKHFRPMVCRIVGEHSVRIAEANLEISNSGDLEAIKSTLGMLWKRRCDLAHSDMPAHQVAQIQLDAPSWTKNQYRIISRKLEGLKLELIKVAEA